jgi:long-chain acyl-CoA synthetase
MASFNPPDRERKPGSIGLPVEGVAMKAVDEDDAEVAQGEVGEIVIRSPHVMKGYFGRDDATAEVMRGGWFHTGDMACVDEDGYFFIVDRKKDLIIRGGFNVYPREIEEVLYEHAAVMEAAVIGVPHESLGEEVAAVVALREGVHCSPEELRAYVKERVAAYKYPRQVWLVDDLPKGPTARSSSARSSCRPAIRRRAARSGRPGAHAARTASICAARRRFGAACVIVPTGSPSRRIITVGSPVTP